MGQRFEDAYAQHYQAVVRSAWSICRDRALAEEVAQEAFVRAYRRWRGLDDGGYAVAWVHRVAMNLALTAVTRRARGRLLELGQAGREPVQEPAVGDDWIVPLLRHLPRRQREAVFLRVVADLPEDHVASLMRCTPGSVKVHKKRGLDRLRALLTEGDRDGDGRTAPAAARG